MIISIQQTLHGYYNGHQLLANSMPINSDMSKILLFQSDLSGSLSNPNFESYLTGYPIINSSIYAFARTWYAREMKRPGCVWTHTLLIKFPDLGKIPDLSSLTVFFERPLSDNFSNYIRPIEIEFNDLTRYSEGTSNADININLYKNTYFNYDRPIIIPSDSPLNYENDIIKLWSNQWPRLRRNFYFCTGALNLKSLKDKIFDVQIVPNEIEKSIMRNNSNLKQFSESIDEDSWVSVLRETSKMTLRKFLWNFGSDIDGKRINFIPLICLYESVFINKNLDKTVILIRQYFSEPKQAKNLKSKLFSEDSILVYPESEKQIVSYLILSRDLEFLSGIDLNISRRLINLVRNNKIKIPDLLDLLSESPDNSLSETLWDDIEISEQNVIELLSKNHEIALPLILRSENLLYNPGIWQQPFDIQKQIFVDLFSRNITPDWNRITLSILEAKSNIIFELFWKKDEEIIHQSLDWYNQGKSNQFFTEEWKNFITKEKDQVFVKWLRTNEKRLHSKTFVLIFDNLHSKKIIQLNFNHNTWLTAYKKLKLTDYQGNLPYVASLLLTIGFNNNIQNSEWLVAVTFQDVYNFAENWKIDNQVWSIIPKETDDDLEESDMGFIEAIFSILKAKPKKRSQIESWDYCEYLIRTLCNKTIKNNWNPGAFLSTLKDQKTFYRAISYCVSMKRGHSFIIKIIKHIENKQIYFEPFQYQYIRKIKK